MTFRRDGWFASHQRERKRERQDCDGEFSDGKLRGGGKEFQPRAELGWKSVCLRGNGRVRVVFRREEG